MADFEQLIGDTRHWLKKSAKPRPFIAAGSGFGFNRKEGEHFESPNVVIVGVESRFILGAYRVGGCLAVKYSIDILGAQQVTQTELHWRDDELRVQSPHTGSEDEAVPLEELSGVTQERIYNQLAILHSTPKRNITANN